MKNIHSFIGLELMIKLLLVFVVFLHSSIMADEKLFPARSVPILAPSEDCGKEEAKSALSLRMSGICEANSLGDHLQSFEVWNRGMKAYNSGGEVVEDICRLSGTERPERVFLKVVRCDRSRDRAQPFKVQPIKREEAPPQEVICLRPTRVDKVQDAAERNIDLGAQLAAHIPEKPTTEAERAPASGVVKHSFESRVESGGASPEREAAQGNALDTSLFAGIEGVAMPSAVGAYQKNIFRYSPEISADVGTWIGDYDYAKKQKDRIFENIPVSNIPNGIYTYVITEGGQVRFGRVVSGWEVGTKHQHLARGEKVVSAGEFNLREGGAIELNLASGTFMQKIAETNPAKFREIEEKTKAFFQSQVKGRLAYKPANQSFVSKDHAPDAAEVRSLCSDGSVFLQSPSGKRHEFCAAALAALGGHERVPARAPERAPAVQAKAFAAVEPARPRDTFAKLQERGPARTFAPLTRTAEVQEAARIVPLRRASPQGSDHDIDDVRKKVADFEPHPAVAQLPPLVGKLFPAYSAYDQCLTDEVLNTYQDTAAFKINGREHVREGFFNYIQSRRQRGLPTSLDSLSVFAKPGQQEGVKARLRDKCTVQGDGLTPFPAVHREAESSRRTAYAPEKLRVQECPKDLEPLRKDADAVAGQGGGLVGAFKRSDGKVVFRKTTPSDETEQLREYAFYLLDQKLGTDRVAPTLLCQEDGHYYTIQESVMSKEKSQEMVQGQPLKNESQIVDQYKTHPAYHKVQVIDYVARHTDRHGGNVFYAPRTSPRAQDMKLIDNGGAKAAIDARSFSPSLQSKRGVDPKISGAVLPTEYPREIQERLTHLTEREIEETLSFLPSDEVEGVLFRLQILKADMGSRR